jgi:Trypsin-like peptidase domain
VLRRLTKTNFLPVGSGVLVAWTNRYFIVTAGHVVPPDEDVFFRIPWKNGAPPAHRSHKEISRSSGMNWLRCTNADLALTTIYLNPEIDDVKVAQMERLAATYENVAVGDEVFVAGYPSSIISVADPGVHVIRNGIVSAKLGNGRILIDAFTFPGNSGGPVFWKPAMGWPFSQPKIEGRPPSLVGIFIQYHVYNESAVSQSTGRQRVTFESNSGLTEIVSTSRILEMLKYAYVRDAIARWEGQN